MNEKIKIWQTIPMEQNFEKCCRRSFHSGQSAFARTLDTVLFNFLRFIAVYFILRQWAKNRIFCFVLSLILTSMIFFIIKMVKKNRFARHIDKLKKDTETELIKQKLILMEPVDYENAVRTVFKADCLILHSAEKVGADSVYEAVRLGVKMRKRTEERSGAEETKEKAEAETESAKVKAEAEGAEEREKEKSINGCGKALPIISIEPFSEGAVRAAERLKDYGINHILAGNLEGIGNAVNISDEDVMKAIMRKYGRRRRKHINFSAALAPDRAKRYLSAGIMLLLLSFVMSFGIYIRLFASLAFTAAGFVFFSDTVKKHKGSDL